MPMFAMYVLSFLAAMSLILIADKTCLCKQQRVAESQVEVATKKLWSPDESERRNGKDELFQLGHKAVPALVSLLDEIVANPASRNFPIGKEAEGQAAFELFYSAPLGPKPGLTTESFLKLEITWRLKSDAYELLGRLRAVEAVPLLIRIMENRDFDNLIEKVRPEMAALITIGAPAVPALMQAFSTAAEKGSRIQFGDPQSPEKLKRYIEVETAKIQNRCAIVLGEIGDPRALPLLRAFLKEEKRLGFDSPYVRRAINKIRNRTTAPK